MFIRAYITHSPAHQPHTHAHTHIPQPQHMLLTADAMMAQFWTALYAYHPDVSLTCSQEVVDEFALAMCRCSCDYQEMLIRVSAGALKAYYSHGFAKRVIAQIFLVKDMWAYNLSALELNNAATKRTATSNASKHLTTTTEGTTTAPAGRNQVKAAEEEGSTLKTKVVITKGYSTSMAYQTVTHRGAALEVKRSGTGIASRETERLFGVFGPGRVKRQRAGPKLANMGKVYLDPIDDTALACFIRRMKEKSASLGGA